MGPALWTLASFEGSPGCPMLLGGWGVWGEGCLWTSPHPGLLSPHIGPRGELLAWPLTPWMTLQISGRLRASVSLFVQRGCSVRMSRLG